MVLRKSDVANMHFNCVLAARVLRRYHLIYSLRNFLKWAQIITILLVKYSDYSLGSFKPIIIIIICVIIIMTFIINAFFFPLR